MQSAHKGRSPMDKVTAADYVIAFVLALVTFTNIVPLWHVLCASFSSPAKLAQNVGIVWWPMDFTLNGYKLVWNNATIGMSYVNTIIYVVTSTALGVLLTLLGGFVSSRKTALFAKPFTFMFTFTMYFSGGLIPFYLVVNWLGMMNTRWAIIIPSCLSAYNMIIMRTSLAALPDSLEESARLDGANDFVVLFRILMPLCVPVIAVLTLYYAVGHWNSWFNAMIFLSSRNLYPLQLVLREILISSDMTNVVQQSANMANDTDLYKALVKYCTVIVATVPILCVYPFVQRYFIKGVMIGAIKG